MGCPITGRAQFERIPLRPRAPEFCPPTSNFRPATRSHFPQTRGPGPADPITCAPFIAPPVGAKRISPQTRTSPQMAARPRSLPPRPPRPWYSSGIRPTHRSVLMNSMRCTILVALLTALAQAQPQAPPKQQRDLTVKDTAAPPKAPRNLTPPRSYALIIGVGKYQNLLESENLLFSERDAESVYSILISPEGGNFRAENIHRLIGPRATLANVRRELEEWLPSVAKEGDRVLVYFAGHGFVVDGRAYLAPYDLKRDNIAATGYPMQTLGSVFGGKVQGKWKVLITDACHSGAISAGSSAALNRGLMDVDKSIFVLSASRDREQSFESADWGGGHGIFTYYVERGLGGAADEDGDGIVTADELAEYVRINVRKDSDGRQNPTSEAGSFDPKMQLAYVPASAKPDAPPPPRFGVMVLESNMDGVEVFIDGKSEGVVNKGTPLRLQGLVPGAHTVKGVKMGYEPDGPREETVYPGEERTVSLKIKFVRKRAKAATDDLDRGLDFYNKGFKDNYTKAAEYFQKALNEDPTYSQAALYLGRTYNALYDQEKAEQYFRKALEIDPDYVEARASFGGMLVDKGAADEAIRQLNAAIRRDKSYGLAWYLLAHAYILKDDYAQAIDAARQAITLIPNKAESHFWLAESLHLSGKLDDAKKSYQDYLRLSNFDSKLAGQLNYWVLGFLVGHGRKSRASVKDIWQDLRSLAYFGMCDCDRQMKRFDEAIEECRAALTYNAEDSVTHYAMGLTYAMKAQKTNTIEPLAAASQHFRSMLRINPDAPEAGDVKKMLADYDRFLAGAK
jgi:tetratricopeptide (TPR) repeat protein